MEWEAIIAGILQGFLEWLPVSSSGQVFLYLTSLLKLNPEVAYRYAIALHMATALSAATYYYNFIARALKNLRGIEFKIIVIPLFAGTPLGYAVYKMYSSFTLNISYDYVTMFIGLLLLATGLLLFFKPKEIGMLLISDINYRDMLIIGLLEGLAVLPGLSRSGIVSAYLLMRGYSPIATLELTFVTGMAATFLAGIYGIYQVLTMYSSAFTLGFLGYVGSFVSAYAAGLASISLLNAIALKLSKSIALFLIIYSIIILAFHIILLI